jgi:hypothetical protein
LWGRTRAVSLEANFELSDVERFVPDFEEDLGGEIEEAALFLYLNSIADHIRGASLSLAKLKKATRVATTST